MSEIRFEDVTKRYAAAEAAVLEGFSLAVSEGQFCVLLGQSGAGKSTVLKLVNRMVDATSGRIFVDGRDVRERDPQELRRGTGYVLQRIGLLPHLDVRENVALVPGLLGWPRARTEERVQELSIHAGRHSFCSHALAGGRNLIEVRDAAGHANVATTSAYLHAVHDDDDEVGTLFQFAPKQRTTAG